MSAEVKYLAAIFFCDVCLIYHFPAASECLLNGTQLRDFVRRVKSASCLNIAMCKSHRGKLLDNNKGKAYENEGDEERVFKVGDLVAMSAVDFCFAGLNILDSIIGRIQTAAVLEKMKRSHYFLLYFIIK